MSLSNRSLPKPENWQDFEHHAWLLFRAELQDHATEKNGRQGQAQHGVDVYGRRNRTHWVGVQCKQKMDEAVTETECPSSDDLEHERVISNGGSGSLGLQSMRLSDDAASGVFRSSWL